MADRLVFCFDIDGVIATIQSDNQYDLSNPCKEMIDMINFLFDQGHKIILFTARGSATGIDWSETTRTQMQAWGVKYHSLLFGKPAADYYIDDKSMSLEQLNDMVATLKEDRDD